VTEAVQSLHLRLKFTNKNAGLRAGFLCKFWWRLMNDVRTSLIEIENAQYLQAMTEFSKTLNTKDV
jgi:hypothetical protein